MSVVMILTAAIAAIPAIAITRKNPKLKYAPSSTIVDLNNARPFMISKSSSPEIDSEYLRYISARSPEQVTEWFNKKHLEGEVLSKEVFYAAQEKMYEMFDEALLGRIAKMTAAEARSFYETEKELGMHFTRKVFKALREKMNADTRRGSSI